MKSMRVLTVIGAGHIDSAKQVRVHALLLMIISVPVCSFTVSGLAFRIRFMTDLLYAVKRRFQRCFC